MSKAPDMLYHMGGVPVTSMLPMLPRLNSKIYWVDGRVGQSGNSGESYDAPLDTIAGAITKVNARVDWSASPWGNRDVIVISPGVYAEALTSMPYAAEVIGLGHDYRDANNGVKILPAAGGAVNCSSAINTAFYNIGFESADTTAAFDADQLNNCLFYNCGFSGVPDATTAVYGAYTTDLTYTQFIHCKFCNADNGLYINYVDSGDKCSHLLVEDCMFTGLTAAGIYTSTSLVGGHNIVRGTTIIGGGQTLLIGIDDNYAGIDENHNAIEASTAVSGVRSSNGTYGNGALLT